MEMLYLFYTLNMKNYYNKETAKNPNTSPLILRKILERGRDDRISCYAALNPNCPPDALRIVLERGRNDWVSCYAVRNLNCPSDVLRMVLERGKDDYVSQWASYNPKCPSDAFIKWMMDTGRIEKEDPEKHIIDKVEEKKVDKDLEILKKMVNY